MRTSVAARVGLSLVAWGGLLGWLMLPAATASPKGDLAAAFLNPPDSAKPWAYWWWLNANVTKDSITRDLQEMKSKGIGGVVLFDIEVNSDPSRPRYPVYPVRRVKFGSPSWRQLLKYAMSEANRLGMEMSMNLSTSDGAMRTPWDTGEQAPKTLVWTSVEVLGPKRVTCVLPRQQGLQAWDVALVAARIGNEGSAAGTASSADPGDDIRFSNEPKRWQPVESTPAGKDTASEVVDLTGEVNAQGRLAWNVPPGRWRVIRFLYTVQKDSRDVDMLDPAAVEAYFNRFMGDILKDAGPLVGKTLTHVYSVSWEGMTPTWSARFESEFTKYRSYSLRPYLPVLAGITIKSPEISRRFLRDYSRTLSDCFSNNCYGKLTELCHGVGIRWHSESGGPWSKPSSLLFQEADALALLGRNDMPQGEFWWKEKSVPGSNARLVASAAHIYGKPLTSIEAFTNHDYHWSQYPATLKPNADAAFCDGANRFIWHIFTASPAEFGQPGIEYTAGTHLNPNVTWWKQAGALLTYLGRCQAMLQQGQFVADVCCYRSDRNYVASVSGRGEPLCPLPDGYAFDLLSTEVLVDRLSVQDGHLVLPGGMRYRLLIVDLKDDGLPVEALRKIIQLAQEGATVVLGPRRPQHTAGLRDYPACDVELRRLTADLWSSPGAGPSRRSLGKGRLIRDTEIRRVLTAERLSPDCASPWKYIHRRANGLDIYFLAGTGDAESTFRVSGKEPELWDPQTGDVRTGICYRVTADGRTAVPLTLPQNGSIFVVFRQPVQEPHFVSVSGPKAGVEIEGCTVANARIRLWQSGKYLFETSQRTQISCEAAVREPLPLAAPWDVRFAPGWGAPESVVFDRLIAWDTHSHPGIKYFSGTATYRKQFQLDAEQAKRLVRLQLGDVKHVAQVRINGSNLGVTWTAPWQIDLSGKVRAGENQLEIDVTNVWVNRLIGDAGLPEDRRYTKTNLLLQPGARTIKSYEGYSSQDPLITSGLLGPVRLEFGQQRELRFSDAVRTTPISSATEAVGAFRAGETPAKQGPAAVVPRPTEPSVPPLAKKVSADPLPGKVEFFQVSGCRAFLLRPLNATADGPMPWIWYAPAMAGPHPSHAWMLQQWLDKGIALAGVSVGESYGSPEGRGVFTAFWKLLSTRYRMSERPCLLPQSRGGLMLYNWAAENPSRVACIAGIYTVCDLRSYPGLDRACGAYGLTAGELEARLADHNPIDRLSPLAKAQVPILHIHGDADKVVPLERNSGELARRYRALGGQMRLIVVPGKGHQVCDEFFHCQELVDFVAAAAGRM